jgi:hypothetical protein
MDLLYPSTIAVKWMSRIEVTSVYLQFASRSSDCRVYPTFIHGFNVHGLEGRRGSPIAVDDLADKGVKTSRKQQYGGNDEVHPPRSLTMITLTLR